MDKSTMQLPTGKTCADCGHFKRCAWLISCAPTNTRCDWAPSRFREAAKSEPSLAECINAPREAARIAIAESATRNRALLSKAPDGTLRYT
jgi:hypothetical protein